MSLIQRLSLNGHPTRHWAPMRQVRHLRNIRLLVLALYLPGGKVTFQPLSEVCGAYAGIDYCDENEGNGDRGKGCHRLSDWLILRAF